MCCLICYTRSYTAPISYIKATVCRKWWLHHGRQQYMCKWMLCSSFVPSPSLSLAMSILPLFICRVACRAGRSWCRRAGSCSSAGDGDWTDWGTCPEEEEEEDMVEGVEPNAPEAEFRLWEEEEDEEWPELDAVDWSTDVVSVEAGRPKEFTITKWNIV